MSTSPLLRRSTTGLVVPGPERTFRPTSASKTVPVRWAGWQSTVQEALFPLQVAVMVAWTVPAAVFRLVTVPSAATAAAEESQLQAMAAPVWAGSRVAISVLLSPAFRASWLTSRVRKTSWAGVSGVSGVSGWSGVTGVSGVSGGSGVSGWAGRGSPGRWARR